MNSVKICFGRAVYLALVSIPVLLAPVASSATSTSLASLAVATGWQLQDASKVPQAGAEVSAAAFSTAGWYNASVPGTVLTTLVNNHVYPEPTYGENNRPEIIPESLARTSWWYRTEIDVPSSYKGQHIWLNFDGINYASTVWVNGTQVGTTRGAFARGIFDITPNVKPGQKAVLAVLVAPQPHPGVSHEHTLHDGVGPNGGESAIDGPTFLCTIGWDWIPAIRDRDAGIWQKVFLSVTGPVLVKNPLVTTDLPLPRTDSADIGVQATVENVSDKPVKGELVGSIENIAFEKPVTLAPHSTQLISFDSKATSVLHVDHPRLWWPNGYGPQNLYKLHLSFNVKKKLSDAQDVSFGVRKISYSVPGTDTLTISVNGVPIFIRGGNWGLDEALKRTPRERLEAEIRLHQLANLNLIRNWVGQSTGEDFYELCDKYGILIWDEFFQPNPGDGPDPADLDTYIANVREKILRYRNHPAIMLWCARNEGLPPQEIDAALRKVLAELEPTRRYQPSSTDGPGVRSHGPYSWRTPREFYTVTDDFFKTETGSVSVPTLESIHGMMPKKDWESINDDWAEHDLAKGNSGSQDYPAELAARYGKPANLADFVRKAQLMNYEAYRAMYEGRNAQMFHPTTAVITWMSNPAQPSFVWQLYHYDLEPNASLFAVKHANELVHIQFNEATGELEVVNNLPEPLSGAVAHVSVYHLDGSLASQYDVKVTALASSVTSFGPVKFPTPLTATHFLKLDLHDAEGKLISSNFYWRAQPGYPDVFTDLDRLQPVTLEAQAEEKDAEGRRLIIVKLHNPTAHIALMAHLQLRRAHSGERVLPVFASDNYISLLADETRTITLEADESEFKGEDALVVVDGWNITVSPASSSGVSIAPNVDAQPDHWPTTGLPYQTTGLR
jgi:Exo-beta-D-glucosaminidase Ig-fold domain/Glycosyl hydrolases family 2, sugar binding domain/Glycosyl hydrolases family 2/Glycosyl hydrolases family 2, TIM barrel domain